MKINCTYWFNSYLQSPDEYSSELVAERFYNFIDKKLMSEHLTQEEYDRLSKQFNSLRLPGEVSCPDQVANEIDKQMSWDRAEQEYLTKPEEDI